MSDQDQSQRGEQGGSTGAGTAAAPQVETGGERGASSRHGRGRRRGGGGGRPEQRQSQPSRRAITPAATAADRCHPARQWR